MYVQRAPFRLYVGNCCWLCMYIKIQNGLTSTQNYKLPSITSIKPKNNNNRSPFSSLILHVRLPNSTIIIIIMSNKKKSHKKKRISKHILQARERQIEKLAASASASSENELRVVVAKTDAPTVSAKRKIPQSKIKDPKEAQDYLSNWNHKDHGSQWKFNKNTQSWIFRHMYESDKIPKASFTLLLEYLSGVQGSTTEWVHSEALRKALRYKDWEAKKQCQDHETHKDEKQVTPEGQNENIPKDTNKDHNEDDERFLKLSDHDKRKEYKRCRKVLDHLKLLKSSN